MADKLISVIVPVYMGEQWLPRCIDTILNQTYTNLDIILVNDGSPDNSGTICDEYADKDSRIRVVHKENGGLSDARNAGLDVAAGDYIMFVDEDDMIHPQMVSIMLKAITDNDADIAVCKFEMVPDVDIEEYSHLSENPGVECFEQPEIMSQLHHCNLLTVVAWNKMYRKEIYEKNRYIKGRIHDDESAIHYILHVCKKVVYIDEKLYYYVQREGSITSKRKMDYYYDGWRAYEERYDFLKNHGYNQMAIWTRHHMLHMVTYNYESMNVDSDGTQLLAEMLGKCADIIKEPEVYENLPDEFKDKFENFLKSPQEFYRKKHKKEERDRLIDNAKKPVRKVKSILRTCWRFYYGHIYQKAKKAFVDTPSKRREIVSKYNIRKGILNVVIFGTPNHGNLGDYAIYVAEKQLLSKYYCDCNIFGVNMTDFQHEIDILAKLLDEKDLLILTGGGNFGNQYMDDEKIRRAVISKFPGNKIIMFPQTMYFTDDTSGEEEKQKTLQIYSEHKDLWLIARDELSFSQMQDLFKNNVRLLPDVVLTWEPNVCSKREGALLVLRNDVERALDDDSKNQIIQILSSMYDNVSETDTDVAVSDNLDDLYERLMGKVEQISGAELVITDRLHGMVFAAITQTPCLVLNNYNHKVRETYKWINNLPYVKYVSDIENLQADIEEVCNVGERVYSDEFIYNEYDKFMKDILGE